MRSVRPRFRRKALTFQQVTLAVVVSSQRDTQPRTLAPPLGVVLGVRLRPHLSHKDTPLNRWIAHHAPPA
jgi:hypothetical protein